MARERKAHTQKQGVQQDDARSNAHISDPSGLASDSESRHPKGNFHTFLRALARELVRADHDHDG